MNIGLPGLAVSGSLAVTGVPGVGEVGNLTGRTYLLTSCALTVVFFCKVGYMGDSKVFKINKLNGLCKCDDAL